MQQQQKNGKIIKIVKIILERFLPIINNKLESKSLDRIKKLPRKSSKSPGRLNSTRMDTTIDTT